MRATLKLGSVIDMLSAPSGKYIIEVFTKGYRGYLCVVNNNFVLRDPSVYDLNNPDSANHVDDPMGIVWNVNHIIGSTIDMTESVVCLTNQNGQSVPQVNPNGEGNLHPCESIGEFQVDYHGESYDPDGKGSAYKLYDRIVYLNGNSRIYLHFNTIDAPHHCLPLCLACWHDGENDPIDVNHSVAGFRFLDATGWGDN